MNTILTVKNLNVILDNEQILRDISFTVRRGEALAIIGPNGAGKTVLFKTLLGFFPYQGEIQWQEGVKICYVPQKFLVEKDIPFTAEEFFLLKSRRFWRRDRRFAGHIAKELKTFGLETDVLKKQINELSGGEFQRLLIAWAMADHPDVLLFDEPTAGIDVGFEETAYQLIHKMQDERNTTVLLISHDLNLVYRYAQSVICLNKKMTCEGPPKEVLTPKELAELYGEAGFYHHFDDRKTGHHPHHH